MIWLALLWFLNAVVIFGLTPGLTIRGRLTVAILWPLCGLLVIGLLAFDAYEDWKHEYKEDT